MNTRLLVLFTFTAALTFGCSSSAPQSPQPATAADAQAGPGAVLTANPNPVPAGPEGTGATTINWKTADGGRGQVFVAINDGPETLFGDNSFGAQPAPWIQANANYEFRLYSGTEHKNLLAKLVVTRNAK
jgi:hypothetical protein